MSKWIFPDVANWADHAGTPLIIKFIFNLFYMCLSTKSGIKIETSAKKMKISESVFSRFGHSAGRAKFRLPQNERLARGYVCHVPRIAPFGLLAKTRITACPQGRHVSFDSFLGGLPLTTT